MIGADSIFSAAPLFTASTEPPVRLSAAPAAAPAASPAPISASTRPAVGSPSGVQGDRDDPPDAGVAHEPNVETPRAAVPPGLPPGYSKVVIRAKTGSGSTYLRYHTPGKTKLLDSRPKCWAHYRAAQ